MPSFYQVSVAAALLAIGAAAPTKSNTFSVGQVIKNPGIIKSGPAAMAAPFIKYGKTMPPAVALAASTSDGTVVATPTEYDSEYLCPVTIGGETLQLDFDTGSSDLWVFSSEQPTSQSEGHAIYTPSKSSTSKLLSGETWDISYGDGSSASGNVYSDNVSVGQATVTAQAVECAETVSAEFVDDTSDGLLGLAFDNINTVTPNQQKTFFFNAIAQGLPSPVFTANLKKGTPGNYNFGYIDSSEYTGSITYVPVSTSNGFWEFTGNGYAVGSGSFVSSSIDAIADTGTTLLYLPAAAVKAYYAKVSGAKNSAAAGGYVFPCSATLPSITLGIGSYKAVVPGTYINYAPYSGSSCFGGIQSNAGIGFSIYGDIFLKSQFVVFNGNVPEIGFAAKPT
ncbi:Type I transmembrane sorting receptor [Xylographa soralifera]|nr:Type I transmembrane sorting receptor [Xylographa soralifera]